jgi:hypothetical protein
VADMSDTFPPGKGVAQGGGVGTTVHLDPLNAVVDNEPERLDGTSAFPRPLPTDPGGTNNAGWMKTSDYGDSYYAPVTDSGGFKQV